MTEGSCRAGVTRMIDIVFPGDSNHHGTLFGGVGLAHMDKVAFITAARHAHLSFVTASCERIDFEAPARLGEIVELAGRVKRVGTRSLGIEVELVAEALLSGERRSCTRGIFNMVAVGKTLDAALPPLTSPSEESQTDTVRMVQLVFPGETSHYGSLYGGHALAAMGKAAFIAATRRCRQPVVMASSQRVDFESQVQTGEVIELIARISRIGMTSLTVEVTLWAEHLQSGERRRSGSGTFVMVAVDDRQRPRPVRVSVDAGAGDRSK